MRRIALDYDVPAKLAESNSPIRIEAIKLRTDCSLRLLLRLAREAKQMFGVDEQVPRRGTTPLKKRSALHDAAEWIGPNSDVNSLVSANDPANGRSGKASVPGSSPHAETFDGLQAR